jgi:NAD(P)-dependent dehydrogenase (short-subunit alcohol dehydrogenase family)
MSDFAGRHIIVTGASSGIGLATAKLLVERGARVSMIARRAEVLDGHVAELGEKSAAAFAADVSNREKLEDAIAAAVRKFGPAYGLFANAGLGGTFAPVADYPLDTFEHVVGINLLGTFWAMRAVLPGMIAAKSGSILVTGSLASERGMAMNSAYVASKHAVLGLSRSVAVEVAPHGVRCNCIIPGFIETPMLEQLPGEAHAVMAAMTPQGRMGTSAEMAKAAAFLLSDEASHITAQSLAVDGGILGTLMVR